MKKMFMIDQKTENPEVKGEAKHPLLPPFTKESAIQKVRLAEDASLPHENKFSKIKRSDDNG
jgi:hypothetical protein